MLAHGGSVIIGGGGDIKAGVTRAVSRGGSGVAALYHLIIGLTMAGGFLVGFLPIYTGFLTRLGGYDTHFEKVDGELLRDQQDIRELKDDQRAGNNDTRQRLDAIIAQLWEIKAMKQNDQKGAK